MPFYKVTTVCSILACFVIVQQLYSNFDSNSAPKACTLDIIGKPDNRERIPIITKKNEFFYPEPPNRDLFLTFNEAINISCPQVEFKNWPNIITVEANCADNNQLNIANTKYNFKDLKCNNVPRSTASDTGKDCEGDGKEIEIGFDLGRQNFLRQIIICFDDTVYITLYAKSFLTGAIGHRLRSKDNVKFTQGHFYDKLKIKDLEKTYSKIEQRHTINDLLGLERDSKEYIKDNLYYLAKGHLGPRADSLLLPQERATFYYVNAAPEWQSINQGNWYSIEELVRKLAEARTLDLTIYTGVYGITTLPHADTEEDTELYLVVDQNAGTKYIPVPKLFWKIVCDPKTERGLVILTVNNPYVKAEKIQDHVICNNIINTIGWLADFDWDPTNINKGYTYACNFREFKHKVAYTPQEINITSILN